MLRLQCVSIAVEPFSSLFHRLLISHGPFSDSVLSSFHSASIPTSDGKKERGRREGRESGERNPPLAPFISPFSALSPARCQLVPRRVSHTASVLSISSPFPPLLLPSLPYSILLKPTTMGHQRFRISS